MSIQVSVTDRGVQAAIARLQGKMADLTPAMREIGEIVVASTQLRFKDQESPAGASWQALALRTILARRKGKGKGGAKVLLDTGRLRNSITAAPTANTVRIGTNVAYAAIHQFGGLAGRNRKVVIPARPFLGISNDDRQEIVSTLAKYFAEAK